MTVFKRCEIEHMDKTYTLWADAFGASFKGRNEIWIYLKNERGAGDGLNIIGDKLRDYEFEWLCKQIGYAGEKKELDAINDVVADIKKGFSPSVHLEGLLEKDKKRKPKEWDKGIQP